MLAPSSALAQQQQQQTVSDVLSFLLTSPRIPNADFFVPDPQVVAATEAAVSESLLTGFSTLPIGSSASGFTYRVEPSLGVIQRSSGSFGSFFTERSLTVGQGRGSLGVTFQHASFDTLDGLSLTDGTLEANSSSNAGDAVPFDVETLTLSIKTDTVTVTGTYGVSDRVDVGIALPLIRLSLEGERVDTYRGREQLQATGTSTASGMGDIALRVKYNVMRAPGNGVAIGAELRLPSGDEENLLGTGEASIKPRVVWSFERDRVAIDTDFGYAFGGLTDQFSYGAAVTVVSLPRLMLIGELAGAWLDSVGELTDTTSPHPTLAGVRTTSLNAVEESSNRLLTIFGVKWNPGGTWLVSGNILRRITTAGLTANWVPTLAVEYSFGR